MTTPTEALAKVRDVLVNAFDYGVDTLIGNTPRNQLNLPLIKDALGLLPILEAAIKDAQDVRAKALEEAANEADFSLDCGQPNNIPRKIRALKERK